MTTAYPAALDTFVNPGTTDTLDSAVVRHSVQHANLNDAVAAMQARVGITGSAVVTSLDYLHRSVSPSAGTISATTIAASGVFTSTIATGTAPLSIASATLVANLYAARAALADSVTANANLTGPITSVGNATSIASQTGTGSKFVVDASPTLITPNLGTPSAVVLTNATGTASGLTAGNVTTNANLTGPITSAGNATSVAAQTGTGSTFVMQASPTLTTPVIGAATGTSLSVSGSLTSTVITGTAPLFVTSTTVVANLNSALLNGATFAAPGTIGTTPGAATFKTPFTIQDATDATKQYTWSLSGMTTAKTLTMACVQTTSQTLTIPNITSGDTLATLGISNTFTGATNTFAGIAATTGSFSGVITSTIVTGTAPFTVASTTQVANLNAASVNGTTASGGGSLVMGGFTLTVPATGSAALIGTANVYATGQKVQATSGAYGLAVRYNGSNEQAGIFTNSGGASYFAENVNYSSGDTYSAATVCASRFGNPGGSATTPWTLDVAAPGVAAAAITWTSAFSVSTVGDVTFKSGTASTTTGTGAVVISGTGGLGVGGNGNIGGTLTVSGNGNFNGSSGLNITQSAIAGGARQTMVVTPAANTTITAGTEVQQIRFALSRIQQWATSTPATQREVFFDQPTYSCDTAAQTITTAATVDIVGAPIAGTNVTITNAYALRVEAGNSFLGGNLSLGTVGKYIQYKSGTGQRAGTAVLVAGTVTVSNTTVGANTLVMLTRKSTGGTIGTAITWTVSNGASFSINSDNPLDTSTFVYELIELV